MIGNSVLLLLAAQSASAAVRPEPFPPCLNGADRCEPWERDWGSPEEDDYTPIIFGPDQTWSIQTRALANKPSASRPKAWIKIEYQSNGKGKAANTVTLYSFDCSEQRFAVLHRSAYDRDGNAIETQSFRSLDSDFHYIVPGTYIAKVSAFVCRGR